MISQNIIRRGGSKLEITRALIERNVGIPVPVSTWKYYGQDLDSIRRDFESMRKPVIVRGSHRNDYEGFIDVVPTYRNVNDFRELENAVRYIEGATESDDVRVHCEDWDQPYTPKVHILVQEQSRSAIVGSMLRHPHDRKQLIIQYFDMNDSGPMRSIMSSARIDKDGDFIYNSELGIHDEEIMELIKLPHQMV